jgi:hypothetical protein
MSECRLSRLVAEKLGGASANKHRRGPSTPRNKVPVCDRSARRFAQDDGFWENGLSPVLAEVRADLIFSVDQSLINFCRSKPRQHTPNQMLLNPPKPSS